MFDYSLIAIVLAAVIGAASAAMAFRWQGLPVLTGGLIGLVAGAAATLLTMSPTNFCALRTDPEAVLYETGIEDVLFAVIIIAVATAAIIASVGWFLRWRMQRGKQKRGSSIQSQQGYFKGWALPIIFLAPTTLVLLLFLYYPALDTFGLATQLAKLGARRSAFVCFDNFTTLFTNPDYLRSIWTTFAIGIAIVVIGMGLALLIATVAYLPIKGAKIYRTLLIWPYAVSPAVAGIIFLLLFNPAGGVINHFLDNLFGFKIGWLNDPYAAPWAVIIASVWKSMGFNILFFLAGLQNVPKDLLEAASIDGANAVQRYRSIVIPSLSPITFFLIITNITYAFFETFGTIDYLTGGGPVKSTTTLMYRIYETGIMQNDLGKGAAQAIVLFVMVIALTVVQFRVSEDRVSYGA